MIFGRIEGQVLKEARRCIRCGACKGVCPVGTDIPEAFGMILKGDLQGAGELLFLNNPLSACCGLVCPVEQLCEKVCPAPGGSIKIGMLENIISEAFLEIFSLAPQDKTGKKIAVIGAGPAGMTVASLLAMRGHGITMYDSNASIGGMMRYGIPDFRLPRSVIEKLEKAMKKLGVVIRKNTLVGFAIALEEIKRDGFDCIFIGTGTWRPKKLGIPGEALGNCHFAIDYLHDPRAFELGERVCVIGAGNTGMDVARTALRNGTREVVIMNRKGMESVAASADEIQGALSEGARFLHYSSSSAIEENGVRYTLTESGKEPTEEFLECDSVVVSISQTPRYLIGSKKDGIDVDNQHFVITDDCGRTSREDVFAHGDVVTGPRTVVDAVRFSRRAAEAMDGYLKGDNCSSCMIYPEEEDFIDNEDH